MKKRENARPTYLVVAYTCTLALLFAVVITTPIFIKGNVAITEKIVIEEDIFEMLLIAALMGLAYAVHRVYQEKLENLKKSNVGLAKSHTEAFKYLGTVNVKLQRFCDTFVKFQRYPETKTELQTILSSAARHLRSIADVDWILIRIINQNNLRTMTEHWDPSAKAAHRHIKISNRALVEGKTLAEFNIVRFHRSNSTVHVVCIMPSKTLMREDKIMIEAIVGELETLFFIFSQQYL
jgi:hypothetical protein